MDEFETKKLFERQANVKKSDYQYGKAFLDDLRDLLECRIKEQRKRGKHGTRPNPTEKV